jgi:hypothetical protein
MNRHYLTLMTTAVALVAAPVILNAQERSPLGAATPIAAVEEFMRAAADSNLTRMAQLFGTEKGSASRAGEPKDFAKRMVVMQAYLHGINVRAVSEVASGQRDHVLVTTEIARGACKVTVPVTAFKSRDGWIVRSFDLVQIAQVINVPCPDAPSGNPSP